MDILVLEIEDPGCFWVAMKGCESYVFDEIEYKNLNAEMNQFYDKYKDVDDVKPVTIEEGQICVVFSEELKCWCRAVIKSFMYCTDDYQTECFLVDYAKYIFVKSKSIRVALEAFMRIPYRAKKCRLYCTKPVTLRVDFFEDTAKLVPAKRWDTAAIRYFQNLLRAATQVKAKICAIEDNTFDVFLHVTIKDEKVFINEDLVEKKFARFEEPKENTGNSGDSLEETHHLMFDNPDKELNLRPVLFQELARKIGTGLATSHSILEETCQRSSTNKNESTASIVKAVPGLPFKENTVVQADRLQQCLSSDPLKTHIIENDQQSSQNLNEERNFVCLSNKTETLSVLETAPLHDELEKEQTWKKCLGPDIAESYWLPVAQGCDVVYISNQGNDPFLYVRPVLMFLQSESCYKALPKKNGPLALILCPGWKKAQLVFELLQTYRKYSRQLHPKLIILGQKKEEARSVKIEGREVIVTTLYSLLRLFEHNSLLFCRLCHLVLDEIEVLFSDAAEQVFTILDCYKKAIIPEKLECSPHQIIAVGTRWNKHIAQLIKEFMKDPYVVITAMEEASIYGNVQQIVQPCTNSERTAVLLKILDFTHSNLQKVLIFTNSVNEAEMVHKALKSKSIFCLKIHRDSDFKYILKQWTKKYSSGTPVVLDDCMQSLGITDATCVIHFSFPSLRIFGQRLHSMSGNFCNLIKNSSVGQDHTRARSVILLTETSARHALEILRYLQHAEAEIPPELHGFTAKMLEAEEDQKFSRPLCAYLKTFGFCKNRAVCPDRHKVNLQMDVPQNTPDKIIQAPGFVTILPLHIVNATNYFGRIVDKQKDKYTTLAEEVNEYFKKPSNKISVKNVQKLAFYGLCERTLFHRVQVVEISPKVEENGFFNVEVKYIDEGRTSQVQNYQLLHLPAKFQRLPPQAVEFIVCRVKPIDNEIEWNPKVTDYINQKIRGKAHEAKIVHTLGNTAWVDPMVWVTRISELKVSVNEYNVRSEILSTGLGTDNPEHITQLQKLCGHVEVLGHAKSSEPLIKEGTADPENASSPQNMLIQEDLSENCNSSKIAFGNHPCDVAPSKEAEETTMHQRKWYKNSKQFVPKLDVFNVNCQTGQSSLLSLSQFSDFYPEIKWFENEETVTVKVVKIASEADCKCEFSKEKVVFSGCSGDKLYLADMELHQPILAEKSTCVIKDEEAVIVLKKAEKGAWCKLLKNKNPHVSFDPEHGEGFEDRSPFPFPVGSEKLYWPAAVDEEWLDFSKDSETESDE